MNRRMRNALVIAAMLVAAAGQAVAEDDRRETNKRLVQGYLSTIGDPAFDDWDRFFADTVTFNGSPVPPQTLGSAILTPIRKGFPDLKYTPLGQIADGDRVATWGFFEGTHDGEFDGIAATHRRVKWLGIAVDRIEDGRVVEMWHEMDLWGLVRQLRAEDGEP